MQLQTTDYKITLTDKLKRKAIRKYTEAIYEGVKLEQNGDAFQAKEINPSAFDKAKEILICECISHVNGEEFIATSSWLDQLNNIDYIKLSDAVDKIKQEHEEELAEGKKNSSEIKD